MPNSCPASHNALKSATWNSGWTQISYPRSPVKLMRPTIAFTMPISMFARKSMKRNAAFETSSSVSLASTARALGPAMDRPTRPRPRARTLTLPSAGRCWSNQRRWYFSAAPDPNTKNCPSPALATVKSPISLPLGLSIGASTKRPVLGILLVSIFDNQRSAPEPVISYLAKPDMSDIPTPWRTAWHSCFTWAKSVDLWNENASLTPGGANHNGVSTPQLSPMTAPICNHCWCIGTVRNGRAAVSSSLGKRTRKRRP